MGDKVTRGTRTCSVCHTRDSFDAMARYGNGRSYGHHACLLRKHGLAALDEVPTVELEAWPVTTLDGLVPLPALFVQKKIAEREEAEKARKSTDAGFPAAIRRGVAAAESEDGAAEASRAAATGLEAKRAAVAALQAACDAAERSGLLPRPTGDGPLAEALLAARAALAREERRAIPIATGDEVHIGSFSRRRGPTFLVSVGRKWITLRGGFAGRYDIDTGFNDPGNDCIDPVDLDRIRRMSGRGA